VNDIGKISDQAINQSMHRSLSAEVVIVVEHDDQLLLNVFQDFIQEHINRPIRLLASSPPAVNKLTASPKIAHSLLNPAGQIAKENDGSASVRSSDTKRTVVPVTKEVGNQGRLSRIPH